ncbi:hypothetical protein AM1_C0321 (plasmid) [Acaryochloris marina MBIC11017]|uniref:Uncharacterized protein n=1 Tax=Acaryochloris marina (strain MBIC 11017) TaxID=329726 RepID=A8ZN50_ACAM1|nr:hypothetical protein AM1_C0321 [Acaryochloris marina MBIC11017]
MRSRIQLQQITKTIIEISQLLGRYRILSTSFILGSNIPGPKP